MRGVLLLSLAVVVGGTLWLTLDDRFYIYRIDVVGAQRTSPEEASQASGLSGLHILWARPNRIEARILKALPALEGAQVGCRLRASGSSAGLSAACDVAVVERQPRVTWDENGRLWWVDADGMIFSAEERLAEGWLVQGPLPRDKGARLEERASVALNELWETGAHVSPVLQYVPGRGFVLTDERGWRVIVGQGPGMARRMQMLEWLAADLQARGVTPRFVDLRFLHAPYYSVTNDW